MQHVSRINESCKGVSDTYVWIRHDSCMRHMYLYTRVHTHKLLGYLMQAQVWDGHLESEKNPDRLKRNIHVDRIGVQRTLVYIYAGLQVLMIWANCFFLLTCLLFCEKRRRCDDNQQITVSHFDEHKRLHLESSKQNYYIISLWVIIRAIFTSRQQFWILRGSWDRKISASLSPLSRLQNCLHLPKIDLNLGHVRNRFFLPKGISPAPVLFPLFFCI